MYLPMDGNKAIDSYIRLPLNETMHLSIEFTLPGPNIIATEPFIDL